MSKHTPGPWKVGRFDDEPSWQLFIKAGNGDVVAYFPSYLAAERNLPVEANARLIAEAPRMAKTLRGILVELDDYHLDDPHMKRAEITDILARIEEDA